MPETLQIVTRSQRFAQQAYHRVHTRAGKRGNNEEYARFAKRFPALVHSCGLAQAIAFAQAKDFQDYLQDLEHVLGCTDLAQKSREAPFSEYLRLSREALAAAGWLKRYAEALLETDNA